MKVNRISLIGIALCLLIMGSCKKQAMSGLPSTEYKTMNVTFSDKELEKQYSATIKGRQDIDIYPQITGNLTKVLVSEGQSVSKGQILFVIDQVSYKAALNQAKANVVSSEASLATAILTYNSKESLFDQKVVSNYDLQQAKNSLLSAEAQLAQAKASEMSARNNLSYTCVKSPANGVVGNLPYRVGTLVSPSMQQALTTVSDNSQMYVYFSINENQLLAYTQKYGSINKVIKQFPSVKLLLNNGTEYQYRGKVESISGVIDSQTGAVTVRAVFPNAGRILHSGATGNVVIPTMYNHSIVIPQSATTQLQDKLIVYKVVGGKAKTTIITIADDNDGQNYVVTSGLTAGDIIVSDGAGMIKEGTLINKK